MPLQTSTVSPGQPITAAMFNDLLAEVRRLGKWSVAPPLALNSNATGYQLYLSNNADAVVYVTFEAHSSGEGSTYPPASDNCKLFPAKVYPGKVFNDEGTCSDDIDKGEAGEEIFVGTLFGQYIPKTANAFAYRVNGQWWTDFVRWKVRGKLTDTMSSGSSASMIVWAWNFDTDEDGATDETMTVYDWLLASSQTIAPSKPVVAFFDAMSEGYYVDGEQCG